MGRNAGSLHGCKVVSRSRSPSAADASDGRSLDSPPHPAKSVELTTNVASLDQRACIGPILSVIRPSEISARRVGLSAAAAADHQCTNRPIGAIALSKIAGLGRTSPTAGPIADTRGATASTSKSPKRRTGRAALTLQRVRKSEQDRRKRNGRYDRYDRAHPYAGANPQKTLVRARALFFVDLAAGELVVELFGGFDARQNDRSQRHEFFPRLAAGITPGQDLSHGLVEYLALSYLL